MRVAWAHQCVVYASNIDICTLSGITASISRDTPLNLSLAADSSRTPVLSKPMLPGIETKRPDSTIAIINYL